MFWTTGDRLPPLPAPNVYLSADTGAAYAPMLRGHPVSLLFAYEFGQLASSHD
jgi:hypothetical protein